MRSVLLSDASKGGEPTPLHVAAFSGHLDVALVLLEGGAKVDELDYLNETPLHKAVRCACPPMVRLLLSRGADRSLQDYRGRTALDVARSMPQDTISILRMLQTE